MDYDYDSDYDSIILYHNTDTTYRTMNYRTIGKNEKNHTTPNQIDNSVSPSVSQSVSHVW